MNIWDKLPEISGDGDLWDLLTQDMQRATSDSMGSSVWTQISALPGGLWGEVEDETMPLDRDRSDIWEVAAEETIILNRGKAKSIWREINDETVISKSRGEDLWEIVDNETLIIDRPRTSVWHPPPRNFGHYKPVQALGWALKKLTSSKGEEYYVLKNLRQETYMQLSKQQLYLWNMMDGSHSIEDMAVANFIQFQTLSPEWLVSYLEQLHAKGFLLTDGVNVYQAISKQLWRHSLEYWGKRIVSMLFQSQLTIKGVDGFFNTLYRIGGRVFFTRFAIILFILISVLGLPAFVYITKQGSLSIISGAGGSLTMGVVTLIVAQLFAVFVHECSHALTTKHYGREVRQGGVGLYFGMIAFFVDTTDIWMEPRGPRLAVTWAGPYSGFILGGLASLALLVNSTSIWAGIAYQFATLCYAISILNLNPLLKLDGYYMLMDWLEMPMLRERAIMFVRTQLWTKLHTQEKFTREDKIFAIFGILALVWTGIIVFSIIRLYGSALFDLFQRFVGKPAAWTIMLGFLTYIAVRLIRRWLAARRPVST